MPKLLVMADDLSGATDVGVQFAKQGVRALVSIHAANGRAKFNPFFRSHDVVIVDLNSRHVSPAEAARRVTSAVQDASDAGVDLFYKKTDSTLRGNVGAELEALLKASGQRTLCFLPAHPALGRTTRDGVHFVHGIPIHETSFANDPRNPVTESRVIEIVAGQTAVPVTLVRQADLARFMAGPPAGIAIFDAETEDDLRRAALAAKNAHCFKALAGPAALASLLPALMQFNAIPLAPPVLRPPLLVVNGSLNEVSFRQCAMAREHGFARVALTARVLFSDFDPDKNATVGMANEVAALLAQGRDVILSTVMHRSECAEFERLAATFHVTREHLPEQVALKTGQAVRSILDLAAKVDGAVQTPFTLVVFGGDTLAAIAAANDWKSFVPRAEVLPGMAASEVPQHPGLLVLSKPGGFGSDDVLLQLHQQSR